MNTKRLETFVFEFENQEIFKNFFEEYYHALPSSGIKCLGASSENLIKKDDESLELIGHLYDIATNVPINKDLRDSTLEKVEKLLGIK